MALRGVAIQISYRNMQQQGRTSLYMEYSEHFKQWAMFTLQLHYKQLKRDLKFQVKRLVSPTDRQIHQFNKT